MSRPSARGGRGVLTLAMARHVADLMALRTSVIDAAVREAIAGGAKQLVILGAGHDGRAWRMRRTGMHGSLPERQA